MLKTHERKLNQPNGMFPKLETLGTTGTYQVHHGVPDKQCFQCFHCSRKWGTTPGGVT